MAEYRVVLSRSAERDLEALPSVDQDRVATHVDRLISQPRPRGVKKLRGSFGLWRIRVGDYRVIYQIDDDRRTVNISHIRHRKDAYR